MMKPPAAKIGVVGHSNLWQGIGLMPIGIFTAMVGGPVFLWMLRPQLGRGEG